MTLIERLRAIGDPCTASMAEIEEVCKLAYNRIEELEAIVERLPVTADGVRIVTGMFLWTNITGRAERFIAEIRACGEYEVRAIGLGRNLKATECYSTREAAEKARTNDT